MKLIFTTVILILFLSACRTSGPGLFGKTTPHEQYGKKLSEAGLDETSLGKLWFNAADLALSQPISVTLPYRQAGFFAADKPRAVGLQFNTKRGQKLFFRLEKNPARSFAVYTELWQTRPGGSPSLVESLDSTKNEFTYDADGDETLILRVQPELLNSGSYELSISIGPSLSFPVAGKSARIGSLWGADRDGGARRHEGIDIFAPKRTPVLASADGTVNRVEETAIGGKVVWLRPKDRNINLYYAHLDEQKVSPGQKVQVGDTLGTVGNTGNARTTPPHLHFGIYGFGGAMDPYPFVNPEVRRPAGIKTNPQTLNDFFRTTRDVKLDNGQTLKKHTAVFVSDVDGQFYLAELPGGTKQKIPATSIQTIDNQIDTKLLKDSAYVYDKPSPLSPVRVALRPSAKVEVLGYFGNHALIKTIEGERGWVPQQLVK